MNEYVWITLFGACALTAILEIILALPRMHRRKYAQMSLLRAKKETQEIAQLPLHNPHPQMQISQSGAILFANPSALKIFPDIQEKSLEHPVLKNIDEHHDREVTYDNKIYQQTISSTFVNGQKAYVVYCHDITERKNYEAQLQAAQINADKMRQSAEAANQARGDFLANMSHELRTPMNGIIGLSDMLVEQNMASDHQDMIEAINNSARNLLTLLNDILDFSKIEANELTIEKTPFDIREIIDRIKILHAAQAAQKSIALETQLSPDIPQYLLGDPSRLQQILNNLISNALKFTSSGSVTLCAYGQNENKNNFKLNLAVKDTGIGIAKNKQAQIFEKFRQADTSTARKYGGTGLGLSITKNLTELMGGQIAIESEPGVGTTLTVTLTLPITQTPPEQITNSPREGINRAVNLMIVDDHPVNLLFLRKALNAIGFKNIDEAFSGEQALKLFKAQAYDLIIMDCQMPDMDGFETTRKIRENQTAENNPIIIASTADAMKGAKEKCLAAGMNDYISKPIEKQKLMSVLQQWLPDQTQSVSPQKADIAPLQKYEDNKIIEWSRINDFIGDDEAAKAQILNIFIKNFDADIKELEKSHAQNDFKIWDACAHKLYGASAHIGATYLAKICDEGQALAAQPDANKTEHVDRIHSMILKRYQEVKTALESLK